MIDWNFDNSYLSLPRELYSEQLPVPVQKPELILFNKDLANELGLSFLNKNTKEIESVLSGNQIPKGTQPIAQAYAGHQFGHFTMLGDGRAILLGERVNPNEKRFDIQLKGSGITPYSRRGDGRATLSAMLREYLMSEAMYALRIPTTRSLAVVKTGEAVYREEPFEGAVLTRVASSHIRVGTFEYAKQFCSLETLKALTDYTIKRHYPEVSEKENPPLELLRSIMNRQISLIVNWMRVGFIHGVMNTDNMSISGETIDYGPCAFMNAYHPETVYSSIDQHGRYAFGNQPRIAHWNLTVFAGSLLPLIDNNKEKAIEKAQVVLDEFSNIFSKAYFKMWCSKLGISHPEEEDKQLINDLMELLEQHKMDYTNFFIALTNGEKVDEVFNDWKKKWEETIKRDRGEAVYLMQKSNPFVIPRNHLVEFALNEAVNGDFSKFNELMKIISDPYDKQQLNDHFHTVPENFEKGFQTFCGT